MRWERRRPREEMAAESRQERQARNRGRKVPVRGRILAYREAREERFAEHSSEHEEGGAEGGVRPNREWHNARSPSPSKAACHEKSYT